MTSPILKPTRMYAAYNRRGTLIGPICSMKRHVRWEVENRYRPNPSWSDEQSWLLARRAGVRIVRVAIWPIRGQDHPSRIEDCE